MTTAPTAARKQTAPRTSRIGWTTVLVLAMAIAAVSLATYLSQSLETLSEDSVIAQVYADGSSPLRAMFYVHVVAASAALVIGPFQFSTRLRRRFTRAHRVAGRIYVVAVVLGGVSGLLIAPSNSAGAVGTAGFGMLAVLWVASVAMAYRAARRRDLAHHQAWMIRNYALTFAAVTLRLWLPLLIVTYVTVGGVDPDAAFTSAYVWVPFLSWVPNVIVAEWLVRRRGLPSLLPPKG